MNKQYIMTQYKTIKTSTNTYLTQLVKSVRAMRDNYDTDINIAYEDLIHRIAIDYNLNEEELKQRYLKKKRRSKLSVGIDDLDNSDSDTSMMEHFEAQQKNNKQLLVKHNYDGNDYFIELSEGGNVYDNNNNIVGKWINNSMELNINLINESKIKKSIQSIQVEESSIIPANIVETTEKKKNKKKLN